MDILKTGILVGLLLLMFAQGLRLSPAHLLGFRREPGALVRAFVAVDLLVPLAAVVAVALFQPPMPIAVGIALMAASPLAPFALPQVVKNPRLKQKWSGIYFVILVAAVVTTPLTLSLLENALGFEARVSPTAIGVKVLLTVVMPVAAGMLFLRVLPRAAARAAKPLQMVGMLLIVASFVTIVVMGSHALLEFGLRGYAAVALFVVLALAAGHFLGGNDREERSLLAVESATRNPALALLIAQESFPGGRVAAVLIPYLVVMIAATQIYSLWKHRRPSATRARRI